MPERVHVDAENVRRSDFGADRAAGERRIGEDLTFQQECEPERGDREVDASRPKRREPTRMPIGTVPTMPPSAAISKGTDQSATKRAAMSAPTPARAS